MCQNIAKCRHLDNNLQIADHILTLINKSDVIGYQFSAIVFLISLSFRFEDSKGYSDKNLWRMKQFYETYQVLTNASRRFVTASSRVATIWGTAERGQAEEYSQSTDRGCRNQGHFRLYAHATQESGMFHLRGVWGVYEPTKGILRQKKWGSGCCCARLPLRIVRVR